MISDGCASLVLIELSTIHITHRGGARVFAWGGGGGERTPTHFFFHYGVGVVSISVARGGGGRGGNCPPIMLFRSFVGTFGKLSVHVSRQACHLYRQSI